MKKLQKYVAHMDGKMAHVGREYAHLAYFGAVFIDGSGVYAILGAVLFCFGILALANGEQV